ncbi:hypothetical protein F2P81_020872 [Scophthalmus maximus]|uniref:Uncharacterized protein n=1 Tax=Scophthalmus maximus TaxID=52904 RepID=A0A6A4S1J3_SCOMX|nr:hypothetical protein F2P81_020872 [Scophthalmus maximus]
MDYEGSGSPAGSGEQPTEDMIGAQIIDEGHGIQVTGQTWVEPTESALLTTTTQLENDGASEKMATMGISSPISKPGNGTSSLRGMGSEGFDHLTFTGKTSGLESGLESELAADTGSALWSGSGDRSESGFATGAVTSQGSAFETHRISKENQQGPAMPTDQKGLDSAGSLVSPKNDLKLDLIIQNRTDEGQELGSRKSEQNLHFSHEIFNITSRSGKLDGSFDLTKSSHENSTPGDLLTPVEDNNNVETTQVTRGNQLVEVTHLPAGIFYSPHNN